MNPLLGLALVAALFVALGGTIRSDAPDFSRVTSQAIARDMAARGELVPVLLFPAELGGADTPENTVYIPPAVVSSRDMITETLIRFSGDGLITKLTVKPEYRGDSVVPARIVYDATGKGKGGFGGVVEVW